MIKYYIDWKLDNLKDCRAKNQHGFSNVFVFSSWIVISMMQILKLVYVAYTEDDKGFILFVFVNIHTFLRTDIYELLFLKT